MKRVNIWMGLLVLVAGCAETQPSTSSNTAAASGSATAAAASGSAIASSSATAASSVDVVMSDVTERIKPPSDKEIAALAKAGTALRDSIAGAQKALEAKQPAKVKAQLAGARKALAEIKKHRPSIEITRHIWDSLGKAPDLTESTTAPTELVPIVRKLVETPEFIADPDAAAELTVDTELPLELVDSVVLYSEIDLPLAAAELDVAAAEGFIAEGKPDRARQVLTEVQSFLSPTLFDADAPIVQARRAALAARIELGEGHLDAVKKHLGEAQAALAKAKVSDKNPTDSLKSAYAQLAKELDSLESDVATGSKAHDFKLARIVESLAALARYETVRVMTAGSVKAERSDLYMALLDVQLSRSVGRLSPSAGKDYLKAARFHLETAAKEADAATKPLVDFARAQIAKLEVTEDENEQQRLSASATMALRDLVYQLRPRAE